MIMRHDGKSTKRLEKAYQTFSINFANPTKIFDFSMCYTNFVVLVIPSYNLFQISLRQNVLQHFRDLSSFQKTTYFLTDKNFSLFIISDCGAGKIRTFQ